MPAGLGQPGSARLTVIGMYPEPIYAQPSRANRTPGFRPDDGVKVPLFVAPDLVYRSRRGPRAGSNGVTVLSYSTDARLQLESNDMKE